MTNVFYASLCHVCKEFSPDLKQCAGCKTFLYCSKEHQKRDWREHKPLCKAIQITNETVNYKIGCSIPEWKRYRLELQAKWKAILKRELLPYENQVWMFPRVCAQCFVKKGLDDCLKCFNVAYCCEQHEKTQKTTHETLCAQLKLCMEIERLLICNKKQYPIVKCIPHTNEKIQQFPENVHNVLTRFFTESDDDSIDLVLKSDCISTFATIAHVLHKHLNSNDFLVCHVVGAASFEAYTDWMALSQNLFHCFPTIKTIEWFLIGPEADYHPTNESNCNLCAKQKRFCSITTRKDFYENVVSDLTAPNLVIALNSGIHEFADGEQDTWRKSVPCLLQHTNVPLMLTAYTKGEILQDLRCIDECISVKVLMEAQVNKYASLRPIRDWDDEKNATSVFYTNGFIAVLEKSV